MKAYIGTKVIKAEPMIFDDFMRNVKKEEPMTQFGEHGYMVQYPDGYKSWSPKGPFENAYREVSQAEIETINSTIPGESEQP